VAPEAAWSDEPLCSAEDKARLESENSVDQLDYITYVVSERGDRRLTEGHILELHRLAVRNIYGCAGRYRTANHEMSMRGSSHEMPEAAAIPLMVPEMLGRLESGTFAGNVLGAAGYALWRINWIHPFAGGNGRTARAAAYLIVCMGLGYMPPGVPSIPSLLKEDQEEYTAALRAVDASVLAGKEELSPIVALMLICFLRQMANGVRDLPQATPQFVALVRRITDRLKKMMDEGTGGTSAS
jgi:Fic family protein